MEAAIVLPDNKAKPHSPSSYATQNKLEREAFRDNLRLNRLKQLDALERKLSGFAGFARERNTQNASIQRKLRTTGRDTALPRIETLRDDIANNNDGGSRFDKSPVFVNGVMRDYQVKGLNWLISLYQNGLNGILADEMGLGKTIQSIAMIGFLMNICKLKGPFLVIVPMTTVNNWLNEFALFLPSAKVLRAHALGNDKSIVLKKLSGKKADWNVTITTYEFFIAHKLNFMRLNFHYAIIDEGHRAKNEKTLFPAVLRQCNIHSMVLLTGTPIHNNLHELWALLNLLMPAFFKSASNFDSWFQVEDCLDPLHEQTRRLHNILEPLMLRRTKAEACKDIPAKVRITLYVPPTEEICVWTRKLLAKTVQRQKPDGSYVTLYTGTVFPYLRQVSLHPFLIAGAEPTNAGDLVDEQIVEYSAKMIVLDKMLTRLKQRGSKVLIFSQFVTMLQILEDYLCWKEYEHCVLHGTLNAEARQEQIEAFNAPGSEKFVFLLSTRAGGIGINLVAADTVIFYDMDFNPQMDFQAEDRAHRIGQRKKVHIFRLLLCGSVEESLYATAERKKQLDQSVMQRKQLTQAMMREAIAYQQSTLNTVELIDRPAVDEKLDSMFRDMGTDQGLQDCVVMLPGIPCKSTQDLALGNRGTLKRKHDEDLLILTEKRRRTQPTNMADDNPGYE